MFADGCKARIKKSKSISSFVIQKTAVFVLERTIAGDFLRSDSRVLFPLSDQCGEAVFPRYMRKVSISIEDELF